MIFPSLLYLPLLPFLWLSQYCRILPLSLNISSSLNLAIHYYIFQREGRQLGELLPLAPSHSLLPSYVASTLPIPWKCLLLKVTDWQIQCLFVLLFFHELSVIFTLPSDQRFLLQLSLLSGSLGLLPSSPSPPFLLMLLLELCFEFPVYLIA